MGWFRKRAAKITPSRGEVGDAKRFPDGYVARTAARFGPNDALPLDAVIGFWKVDEHGVIVGEFIPNEKYDPIKWPWTS